MTKIVGHRGAMGLAFQNTISAIKTALKLDLYAIEIDVRLTADGHLVLLHDANTGKVSPTPVKIHDHTLAELDAITLHNGDHIPTLEEVFKLVGSRVALMLDIKDEGVAEPMLRLLAKYPTVQVFFSGRQYTDLKILHEARPDIPFLIQHHFDPIDIIHNAHAMGAHGICLNMWLMNPLTYRMAKERQLEVYVYSVNSRWLLKFYQLLYPDAILITNHPTRLLGTHRLRQYIGPKKQQIKH
ncbi:MAG TPA: glycerophosphodiester phosphodiesterase [Candidatus Saccharimonadales bacterium]|nr:glycerophosphodiester phosphodiesterase [Candidatus Saccharimonadales bacterium]